MSKIFPESKSLKEIIESHNWQLYDVTNPPENRAYTWEEIEKKAPAGQFEIGHNYLFVPIPKKGETLRQAYTPTKGLGPSLIVEDAEDETKWAGIYNVSGRYYEKKPILFTRLGFDSDFLVAFTPKTIFMPESDIVGMIYPNVIDNFRKYFRIVSPEEDGKTIPIPPPIVEGRMN